MVGTGIVAALWALWLLGWGIAAFDAKPTRRAESVASRLGYLIPLCLGGLLMWPRVGGPWLDARFMPQMAATSWIGPVLVALGLGFTGLARVSLGRNWSATVTVKQNHELIRSGPYRWVRHPIYTGLLVALFGTALAIGEWRALLGFAFMVGAILRKLSIEERFLTEEFGDAYNRYRAEVPAVLPFWR
jgi:protein-S-isoprenylcysteine O-methyltransferase Ste14